MINFGRSDQILPRNTPQRFEDRQLVIRSHRGKKNFRGINRTFKVTTMWVWSEKVGGNEEGFGGRKQIVKGFGCSGISETRTQCYTFHGVLNPYM